jgi:ABC-type amino acid transport substrate-binding protein
MTMISFTAPPQGTRRMAAAAIALCLAATGCGSDDADGGTTAAGASAKTLTVGINPGFVPFEQLEKGKLVGMDVDLARALGKRLNRTIKFDQQPFTSLIASVKTKRDDVAISGILDTADRRKSVTFSKPYVLDAFVLSVPRDDATTTQLSDLAGKNIAVQVGTIPEDYVRKALPSAKLVTAQDTPSAFSLVEQGRAAGVVTDAPVAGYYIKQRGGALRLVPKPLGAAQPIAVVLPKGDPLKADVDDALAAMESDGTLPAIRKKWFGRPDISTASKG